MRTQLNQDVPLAQSGEFAPLQIGPLTVDPPVVLAPMAGVTNAPYRTLCRRFSAGRCLYVSEMITARSFAMGNQKTLHRASFGDDETTRSIQLYGTRTDSLGEATRILVGDWGVDHIDINLGCPVRKVTSQGGGAAIPARPRLMGRLIGAVVEQAGAVPVTVKFRTGVDDDLITFRDAGRVARESGVRAVALHARTAAQLYNGDADWAAITELKSLLPDFPVLGNGDIFEPYDALRMMRVTGCDGVVIGRGCLGRPWLFGELVSVFDGVEPSQPPNLGGVADAALEHARLLVDYFGERVGIQQMRKFTSWYLKAFPGAKRQLPSLHLACTYRELEGLLRALPADQPYPLAALRARRAKSGRTQDKVSLPHGFLDDRDDQLPLDDPAEITSGG